MSKIFLSYSNVLILFALQVVIRFMNMVVILPHFLLPTNKYLCRKLLVNILQSRRVSVGLG